MEFFAAARDASFGALAAYVAVALLSHLLRWQRFSQMHTLGIVTGCVIGIGACAQCGVDGWARYAVIGLAAWLCGLLFDRIGAKFPLPQSR